MADHTSKPQFSHDERPIRFLFENSAFLILGTIVALVWANSGENGLKTHRYFFRQFELSRMFSPPSEMDSAKILNEFEASPANGSSTDESHSHDPHANGSIPVQSDEPDAANGKTATGHPDDAHAAASGSAAHSGDDHGSGGHPVTWYFVINDILMAFFFAIATKEVWESLLPGGALSNPRKAALPLLATFGGVAGPALMFIAGAVMLGQWESLGRGWAVPCATDIAFSYLVGRLIFGNGHPAIAFLLLLAIADDAAGLIIIAVAYPQEQPDLIWLLLSVAGMAIAFIMSRFRIHSFWWYLLIPGTLSWFGFFWSHIHPALCLVPIIPFFPHAKSDLGMFVRAEWNRNDTLSEFEHWWKNPVEIILGLFGLCNAGVAFGNVGAGTWLVMIALIIGKPLGITLCTWVGDRVFRLTMPEGMDYRDVITLGCVAGIGFTVALFVATAAFKATDPNLDPVKMGALLSFGAAIVAIIVSKALGVKTWDRKMASSKTALDNTDVS